MLQRYLASALEKLTGAGNNQPPSLDSLLADMVRELGNFTDVVPPAPESKPRMHFDSDLPKEKQSLANLSTNQMRELLPIFFALRRHMKSSSKMYDGKFRPSRHKATSEFIIY